MAARGASIRRLGVILAFLGLVLEPVGKVFLLSGVGNFVARQTALRASFETTDELACMQSEMSTNTPAGGTVANPDLIQKLEAWQEEGRRFEQIYLYRRHSETLYDVRKKVGPDWTTHFLYAGVIVRQSQGQPHHSRYLKMEYGPVGHGSPLGPQGLTFELSRAFPKIPDQTYWRKEGLGFKVADIQPKDADPKRLVLMLKALDNTSERPEFKTITRYNGMYFAVVMWLYYYRHPGRRVPDLSEILEKVYNVFGGWMIKK